MAGGLGHGKAELGVAGVTILEKKVDAIARSLLASDTTARNYALGELKTLMQRKPEKYEDTEDCVREILLELGVPDGLTGYRSLAHAVSIVARKPWELKPLRDGLYTQIAQELHSTPSKVERGARYAIEVAWDRMGPDLIQKYFGNTVCPMKGRPTNGEFIARAGNIVRERMGGA